MYIFDVMNNSKIVYKLKDTNLFICIIVKFKNKGFNKLKIKNDTYCSIQIEILLL